jgi:hypothetical protein
MQPIVDARARKTERLDYGFGEFTRLDAPHSPNPGFFESGMRQETSVSLCHTQLSRAVSLNVG